MAKQTDIFEAMRDTPNCPRATVDCHVSQTKNRDQWRCDKHGLFIKLSPEVGS